MVLLTLRAEKNGQTFTFDSPINKVSKVCLISCVIPNSWKTLKENATIKYENENVNSSSAFVYGSNVVEAGNYTPSCIRDAIANLFKGAGENPFISFQGHRAEIFIGKISKSYYFSDSMAQILGFSKIEKSDKTRIMLNMKREYFVHCSLLDRDSNLFNGERLSCFPISGKPFEFVKYGVSGEITFRNCLKRNEVSTIQISVKDLQGKPFDFEGYPLLFELEIL